MDNEEEKSLSAIVGHCWTELGKHLLVCLFLLSLYLLLNVETGEEKRIE